MSIVNLESTGLKDQSIVCKNLTVLNNTNLKNLVTSGSVDLPDPLTLNDDLNVEKNVVFGLTDANTFTLNGGTVQYNNDYDEKINDNSVASKQIISNGNTLVTYDTTSGSENINYNCGISIANNDLELTTGSLLVNNASVVNSVSKILVASGTHNWSSGQAPGANILSLSGLNGNLHKKYSLEIDFLINSSATTNFIVMNLNGNTGAQYNTIEQLAPASPAVTATGANNIPIIKSNLAFSAFGMANIDISVDTTLTFASRVNSDVLAERSGGTFDPNKLMFAGSFRNPSFQNITSIDIDLSDANHTGCTIVYRLYRSV